MGLGERILGPRVPAEEMVERRVRYRLPKLFFGLASVLLAVSAASRGRLLGLAAGERRTVLF